MNYERITIQDCLDMFNCLEKRVVIEAGQVVEIVGKEE